MADVHNEADESNRSLHTLDSLHVMFTEPDETITGKDLVNVMNRFAEARNDKNQQKHGANVG